MLCTQINHAHHNRFLSNRPMFAAHTLQKQKLYFVLIVKSKDFDFFWKRKFWCALKNFFSSSSPFGLFFSPVEEIKSAAEFAVSPKFLKKLVNLEVAEGGPARFECKVVGSPRPEVRWFLEGREIQSMPHKRITTRPDGTCTLEIQQVFADDSGRISITAMNPAGQVTCSSQLLVEGILMTRMMMLVIMMIRMIMIVIREWW